MYTLVLALHIMLGFVLILAIVVFQTSKGSALSMFGGGGDALFNAASGTSFIKKFTIGAAACFAVTSLLLTVMASGGKFRSVVQEFPIQAPAAQTAPAVPSADNAKNAVKDSSSKATQTKAPEATKKAASSSKK